FNIMAEKAITIRGFAEAMARWFGREANLKYLPMDEWVESMDNEYDIEKTISHVSRSPNCSIEKAKTLLGYQPRYSPLQAVQEAVTWHIQQGIVDSPWN
ncbi:NAD(P)-dependent oxidoreductase, partial [Dehalococcoides mccartyi]|nr:NAD(P)-dependent oxidoreductase [Dehalococcoides mccartyi]